jgi:hypothetical protein
VNNDEIKLDDLIERSSLGTAGARLRRQRASKVRVESVWPLPTNIRRRSSTMLL